LPISGKFFFRERLIIFWLAFAVGMFVGFFLGILIIGLLNMTHERVADPHKIN
jgi:uncharacterized membrane-anchored protein YhcB (DUF1043 family)